MMTRVILAGSDFVARGEGFDNYQNVGSSPNNAQFLGDARQIIVWISSSHLSLPIWTHSNRTKLCNAIHRTKHTRASMVRRETNLAWASKKASVEAHQVTQVHCVNLLGSLENIMCAPKQYQSLFWARYCLWISDTNHCVSSKNYVCTYHIGANGTINIWQIKFMWF